MILALFQRMVQDDLMPFFGVVTLALLVLFYVPSILSYVYPTTAWKSLEIYYAKQRQQFIADAAGILKAGQSKSDVFKIVSDNGYKTILSPTYASEISRLSGLSFTKTIVQDLHKRLGAFDPFLQLDSENEIFQDAVRMKLTKALGGILIPLSEEASVVLRDVWTDNGEWHDIALKPSILRIIAQLSSRVFLGDKVCRDPDWLRVTVDYTVDAVRASEDIRLWPMFLRPIVAPFMASYKKIMNELNEAKRIIDPILEERRRDKETALLSGKSIPYNNDAMEWMEQTAKGRPYHQASMQLTLSVVSIHTTSDMTTQAIFDLCARQELVQELRKEIISVITQEGWKKTALYKLQLMDSFLKESQRMKPINIVSLRRIAKENIRLRDGTQIAKSTSLVIPNDWMWDEQFYENPNTFDPYRFLKQRQTPGQGTHAHLVTPSPEHLGWGLGNHACPGRFFAANEIKILLCYAILRYDFKFAEGSVPQFRRHGFALHADTTAKISIRRRREEIILDDITD